MRHYDVDIMNLQRAKALVPASGLIEVQLESGATLKARTVVISTGARWRNINVPGEKEYRNKGVAYCPHCDGPLFKGKRVAVIGGGNSGVEAAIDLAGIVAHVTLLEFDTQLRADAVLQRKLRSLPNVDGAHSTRRPPRSPATGRRSTACSTRTARRGESHARRTRRRVRADRPGAQHRLAEGHGRAVAGTARSSSMRRARPRCRACSPPATRPRCRSSRSSSPPATARRRLSARSTTSSAAK